MSTPVSGPFEVTKNPATGQVASARLYGQELLQPENPCTSELWVNGHPLQLRPHTDPNQPGIAAHLKGEHYVNHFSGWGLVVARSMGGRSGLKHNCFGIETLVRREICDQTLPCPGPGGPVIEAPLWIDTLTVLGWNWQFWGEDTRMIFPSSHSSGPIDEHGHAGYEHDTPANVKQWLQNPWRRIYPGCLVIHGGLFYNARTEHWLALTCRRPNVGYEVNIKDAGEGVAYDFTLHAHFGIGESLRLPEIKIYYGPDRQSMESWLGDYVTHYLQETPEWVHKSLWAGGLAWDNEPTWTDQADKWEADVAEGKYDAVKYSLVTDRPIKSGTSPYSYEPDPNHGTQAEFKAMGHRLKAKNIPWLFWMSHSGLMPGSDEMDEDWFIRGIDGRACAAWGNIDLPSLNHINPGHPGYIAYTKKWIKFYIEECGAKGVFFDCLSWAFPPDFRPRPWMRYPGDTNRMALRFADEICGYVKELDPEAIVLGEGTSIDFPVHIFSVHTNPKRAMDGLGPRDWFLLLNRHAPKQLVIDQGPAFAPACGMTMALNGPENAAKNHAMQNLLRTHGGKGAWTPLPGDLSWLEKENLLVVPDLKTGQPYPEFSLPQGWDDIQYLEEITDNSVVTKAEGRFRDVPAGIYRAKR